MQRHRDVTDEDYRQLLELRDGLRRFLRWSEERARAGGLTAAQHQLLLAVRGHPAGNAPTVGEVADHLLLRHHSAVQLVDRAERAGLVRRDRDDEDHRRVRLSVTEAGERALASLAAQHLEELSRVGLAFGKLSIRMAK
ncbi:MAG TPA: helix-turn-helix domain-containing protein [Actinomycetota bacterium]|nr:helix-turn-helix domain-containing protein [Actinomycetota bacterium]